MVNLGCGLNAAPGWVNIDRSPSLVLDRIPGAKRALHRLIGLQPGHLVTWPQGIRRLDITKGLPFERGSVRAVYSSHMLEHLYLSDAQRVLVECHRVLEVGGVLRLALPDSDALARRLVEGGSGRTFNEQLYAYPLVRPNWRGRVLSTVGASIHHWQPTRDLVRAMLQEAGFPKATERVFRQGTLPDLLAVEHREESMFWEAST
jgi:predicted SAM-dependent methyltransferase